jgi:hypothetical protein
MNEIRPEGVSVIKFVISQAYAELNCEASYALTELASNTALLRVHQCFKRRNNQSPSDIEIVRPQCVLVIPICVMDTRVHSFAGMNQRHQLAQSRPQLAANPENRSMLPRSRLDSRRSIEWEILRIH